MGMMHEFGPAESGAGWQAWRCTAGSCSQALFLAARCRPGEDLWRIYERPGWVIAATEPVCPACGATMERQR